MKVVYQTWGFGDILGPVIGFYDGELHAIRILRCNKEEIDSYSMKWLVLCTGKIVQVRGCDGDLGPSIRKMNWDLSSSSFDSSFDSSVEGRKCGACRKILGL